MPDPTPVLKGHAGAVLIGASEGGAAAICGKLTKWGAKLSAGTVEGKGAGAPWDQLAAIANDWEFNAGVEFDDSTTFDMNLALLGLDTYIGAKRKYSDTGCVFGATGLLSELTVEFPSEDPCTGEFTVKCSKGVAPTISAPVAGAGAAPSVNPIITGHSGVVLIGSGTPGAAIAGKLLKATLKASAKLVESKGAALSWKVRGLIKLTWEISVDVEMEDDDATFPLNDSLLGADTYIAIKRKSGDTNPVFAATGMLTDTGVDAASEEIVTRTITVKCSKGVVPSADTSPAS